ncbi:response regulator [Paraburkholderia phymatum]|uniref:Response regulator receiver protein n=1 Tax=Paraburkholderia phymatum (strain DSM 17167 / CIP 108236 / LMG 21445 / STM815) TaxID=391038 RepID=B2JUR5_PARP8|nr:response regulator [Paraburkholderia phymatum]ACC76236.1 response regulator receiver protein [Paraburkholderia phymatum STM815]
MSRVLLVDDDANLRDALSAVLDSAGHDVIIAHDGMEAVRLAPISHPQIIVSDVMMPEMDGPTMVRELRAMPGFLQVPVIMMSALVTTPAIPVAAMLRKPFAPTTLLDVIARLSALIEQTQMEDGDNACAVRTCDARIRRGVELIGDQEKRVHRLRSLGFDTRLAEQVHDRMKGSVDALVLFRRIL